MKKTTLVEMGWCHYVDSFLHLPLTVNHAMKSFKSLTWKYILYALFVSFSIGRYGLLNM